MIYLVSLEDAKTHLRILHDDSDSDIEMKLAAASAIVMQHYKLESVPAEWLVGSPPEIIPPGNIQAATLLVLSELFEQREAGVSNPLSASVKSLIPRRPHNRMTWQNWEVTPQRKTPGETRTVFVDFTDALALGETLTGTPTAIEQQTTALTITDTALTSLERTLRGHKILPGYGVQFSVSGGMARSYYTIRVTIGTAGSSPAQTLVKDVRLHVTA